MDLNDLADDVRKSQRENTPTEDEVVDMDEASKSAETLDEAEPDEVTDPEPEDVKG